MEFNSMYPCLPFGAIQTLAAAGASLQTRAAATTMRVAARAGSTAKGVDPADSDALTTENARCFQGSSPPAFSPLATHAQSTPPMTPVVYRTPSTLPDPATPTTLTTMEHQTHLPSLLGTLIRWKTLHSLTPLPL